MASYEELSLLFSNDRLRRQVKSAMGVAAYNVIWESDQTPNHANRLKLAKVWARPTVEDTDKLTHCVLSAMHTNTVAEITTATDATVQGHIDVWMNIFADGS